MAITRIFNIFEQDDSFIAQIADPEQLDPIGQGQSENQIEFEEKYDIQPQSEDHVTEWVKESSKKKVHFTGTKSDIVQKMQKLKLKLPNYKSPVNFQWRFHRLYRSSYTWILAIYRISFAAYENNLLWIRYDFEQRLVLTNRRQLRNYTADTQKYNINYLYSYSNFNVQWLVVYQ